MISEIMEDTALIAVIGDVHAQIDLAAAGLAQIEAEFDMPIRQVFSVGDFGLFLDASDWGFLSGPKKYCHPEWTDRIRRAWDRWRWPVSAIGGNHEPWNRLRDFDAAWFGDRFRFTTAGAMDHSLDGLRVYGLSGIHHPEHPAFPPAHRLNRSFGPRPATWPEMVAAIGSGKGGISIRELTYYKTEELERLLALPEEPHLLLTHDWPVCPEGASENFPTRPERDLLELLRPRFHFVGHHHRWHADRIGATDFRALNIIADERDNGAGGKINAGWAFLLHWDSVRQRLQGMDFWPNVAEE